MQKFINRLLYSLYCFEGLVFIILEHILLPLKSFLFRMFWKLDVFRTLHRDYGNFEEYKRRTQKIMNYTTYNLDIGANIMNAEAALITTLFPYFMLLIGYIEYLFPELIPKSSFIICLFVSIIIATVLVYFFSLRNNIYKRYFSKFRNSTNNKVWHIVTLIVICGACISAYYSFFLLIH